MQNEGKTHQKKRKRLGMKKKLEKERKKPFTDSPDVSPLICSLTDFQNKLGLR